MSQKHSLINDLRQWMIPCEVQGDQMRNQMIVIGDGRPRLHWHLKYGDVAKFL